jgi:hypothetical protein
LIYRLGPISAADSGGARRDRARRQRGDAVARGSARGKTTLVSEGGATGRADRVAGRVRPEGLAQIGGPGPIGGPGLAEREVRGRGFNQKFKKKEIELKKRVFRKNLSTPN